MHLRPTISPRSRHPAGSAMVWSLALLCLAALVQLALFVAIQARAPVVKNGTNAEMPAPPAPPPVAPNPPTLPAAAPVPVAVVDLPETLPPVDDLVPPPPKSTRPLVARPAPVPVKPAEPRVDQPDPAALPRDDVRVLVADAVRMRRGGDMAGAVGKLNTALDLLPGHPRVIFEMAATYEAMGMTERALENYRNVADMGAARAGALYPIAENRLKNGIQTQRGPDADSLYFGDIEEIVQPTPDGQSVVLRCNVHCALGRTIDPAALSLPVRFFDLVDGNKTEISNAAPPEVHWSSPPIDWKEPGIETVEITCRMPTRDDAATGQRKYLGYMVELYYQDALLDMVARPRRLARFSETPALPPDLPDALPEALGGALLDQ